MLPKTLFFIALNIGGTLAAAIDARNGCNKYVLISARGTTEKQGPSVGFKDMIKDTLASVRGGDEYDVVYPANTDQNSTQIGADDIENYIYSGLRACPEQKYALLGYSQGATVVLKAIKALTGTVAENAIEAVLFIGNPFQVKNQPTTVDQTGGDSTRDKNGVLLLTDPSNGLSQHWVDSGKALNICFKGDSVCIGVPEAPSWAHYQYGRTASVQNLGSEHLVSKLE